MFASPSSPAFPFLSSVLHRSLIDNAPYSRSSPLRRGMLRFRPSNRHSLQSQRATSPSNRSPEAHAVGYSSRRMLRVRRIESKWSVLEVQARDRLFRFIESRQRLHLWMGGLPRMASRWSKPVYRSKAHGRREQRAAHQGRRPAYACTW